METLQSEKDQTQNSKDEKSFQERSNIQKLAYYSTYLNLNHDTNQQTYLSNQ